MHSPSPQLLRALRAIAPRRRVCYDLLHQSRVVGYGLRASCKSDRAVRTLSAATAFNQRPGYQKIRPARSPDRGPKSTEDTQTDFGAMDILGNMSTPATSIDACISDGFHLNNGIKTSDGSGIILVGGEAFSWRPWEATSPKACSHPEQGWGIGRWRQRWCLGYTRALMAEARFVNIWHWRQDLAIKQGDERIHQWSWDQDRCDGHGERICGIQSIGYGEGTDSVAAVMLPLGWMGR